MGHFFGVTPDFWATGGGTVAEGIIYTVSAALILWVARAVSKTYGNHQEVRRTVQTQREFFFDTPADPDAGTPFHKGWVTTVEERLDDRKDGD